MKSDEDRRDERRKYQADVAYDVWRSGGNMDAVDYERVRDGYYDSLPVESAAEIELRAQRPRPQPQPEEQTE